MKISLHWLSDFIELTEKNPSVIGDQLTRCMGEVDDIVVQGAFLEHCVVGKILTVEKHSNADTLNVCTVQTDQGIKTVVCGGTNVRVDMLVAFAHVGATVKHGTETLTLSRIKIRGIESEGMICAQEELDLTSFPPKPEDGKRPIADLSKGKYEVGTPLRTALEMNDVIFHIDNHAITNRPDLFSHIGVARELVAMGLATWKKQPVKKMPVFPKKSLPFEHENSIPVLVPRYLGCCIAIEESGQTPDWMRRRLEAVGSRSINLAVDITNYVSQEIGMPLHSFDVADLQGPICIRTAKKGEHIITLDSVDRELPEGAIVLSDKEGIFDLLGIMGGLRSSTKASTKLLYLHAAIVDAVSIRKAVTATGHRTDASTVYEKGIPIPLAEQGFSRAVELMLDLIPGAKIVSSLESFGADPSAEPISIPESAFALAIGTTMTPTDIQRILEDLGFSIKIQAKNWQITPPAWRSDIRFKQDIIEEVARTYGYANIPPLMPEASIAPPKRDKRLDTLRDSLSESGSFEMLHLAFMSPKQAKQWAMPEEKAVSIENPIGEEMSLMRMSLSPSLIETMSREVKHITGTHLKAFEVGHVFLKKDEHAECTLAVVSRGKTTIKDAPLLMAKADIKQALKEAGYEATFRRSSSHPPFAHQNRSAEILCENTVIGTLCEIHPRLSTSLGIGRAAVATLQLKALFALPPQVKVASALPLFPAIILDETVAISTERRYEEILKNLRKINPLLREIEIIDMYEKDSLQTVTLRFLYRGEDRTLTQQEVEKIHALVVAELKKV